MDSPPPLGGEQSNGEGNGGERSRTSEGARALHARCPAEAGGRGGAAATPSPALHHLQPKHVVGHKDDAAGVPRAATGHSTCGGGGPTGGASAPGPASALSWGGGGGVHGRGYHMISLQVRRLVSLSGRMNITKRKCMFRTQGGWLEGGMRNTWDEDSGGGCTLVWVRAGRHVARRGHCACDLRSTVGKGTGDKHTHLLSNRRSEGGPGQCSRHILHRHISNVLHGSTAAQAQGAGSWVTESVLP